MIFFKKGRFFYRFARELSKKYTTALFSGLLLGVFTTWSLWYFGPTIQHRWLTPVQRIGLIGEYTPTNLPLSIQLLLSSGLTSTPGDGKIEPALATQWEVSADGRTYTFHLRNDAIWHNGKQVEAKDINYNIRNVVFVPKDTHTISVNLQESHSPFTSLISKPIFLPGLKGFGDYKLDTIKLKGNNVEYMRIIPVKPGQKLTYEFHFYRTEAQAITAFKLGDVDILEDLSSVEPLRGWGPVEIEEKVRSDRIITLYFNLKDRQLQEKSFRQALAYGLPAINEERAFSPISLRSWAYYDKVKKYDPNIDQSKKILKSLNLATSSGALTISTLPSFVQLAQSIANQWSSLGFPTQVKVQNTLDNSFQILLSAHIIPSDPDQYPFWHSTQSNTNITGYVNVKVDKLLEDGRREMDQEKRKQIYIDFQKRIAEDVPAVFLYYPKTYTVKRKK